MKLLHSRDLGSFVNIIFLNALQFDAAFLCKMLYAIFKTLCKLEFKNRNTK